MLYLVYVREQYLKNQGMQSWQNTVASLWISLIDFEPYTCVIRLKMY